MSLASRWVSGAAALVAVVLVRTAFAAPPNDACSAATAIVGTPFTDSPTLVGATTEPGDPSSQCGCSATYPGIWYAKQFLYDDQPFVRVCDPSVELVSTLKVLSNVGDQIVINVPRVAFGTCAQPDVRDAVINVPGPGGAISVGTQLGSASVSSVVLLAPERRVKVHGSAADLPPLFGAIYAGAIKTTGAVQVDDQVGLELPCHPDN